MAKKSMIIKNIKRKLLIAKYLEKRNRYIFKLKNAKSQEEKDLLNKKIQKLPRNSSPIRFRNRCWNTGRPRGFLRFFGACRNIVRKFIHNCFFPGVIPASW